MASAVNFISLLVAIGCLSLVALAAPDVAKASTTTASPVDANFEEAPSAMVDIPDIKPHVAASADSSKTKAASIVKREAKQEAAKEREVAPTEEEPKVVVVVKRSAETQDSELKQQAANGPQMNKPTLGGKLEEINLGDDDDDDEEEDEEDDFHHDEKFHDNNKKKPVDKDDSGRTVPGERSSSRFPFIPHFSFPKFPSWSKQEKEMKDTMEEMRKKGPSEVNIRHISRNGVGFTETCIIERNEKQ